MLDTGHWPDQTVKPSQTPYLISLIILIILDSSSFQNAALPYIPKGVRFELDVVRAHTLNQKRDQIECCPGAIEVG